jgi:hypothetical protein
MAALVLAPLLTLLLAASAPGQTFLVDDDGPADFVGIGEAIASPLVTPGATLLVADGTYSGFTLTRSLHILPVSGQTYRVLGPVVVDQAPSFSLVGANLSWLTVRNVPGRGLVDRCSVEALAIAGTCLYQDGATRIQGCAELLIQRSSFRGGDANYEDGPDLASHGATIASSTVTITDSHFQGGSDQGEWGCYAHYPTLGQGLDISQGSVVLLAGTTAETGTSWGANDVPAVGVHSSVVVVRGNSTDALRSFGSPTAWPISLDANSTVAVSGVQLQPALLPAGVLAPSPAEPFLQLTGGEAPGSALLFELFGPLGSPALVGVSSAPALLALPGFSESVWLDPAALFATWPLATAGQEVAVGFGVALPWDPALTGLALTAQSVVDPGGGGGPWLTNAFQLVLGG